MTVFGEAAEVYADVRPGYPPTIPATIASYAGPISSLVEIGAGTGSATAVLRGLARHVLCLEPDARMAAQVAGTFPDVDVVVTDFESWSPPPAGVPLIAGALVWHWLDPATRGARVHAALTPGGVLAVIGRRYGFGDAEQQRRVSDVLNRAWPTPDATADGWIAKDVRASGLFTDIDLTRHDTTVTLTSADYVRLVSTYSPFLRLSLAARADVLGEVRDVVDATGGSVVMRLATTLTLARRPFPDRA